MLPDFPLLPARKKNSWEGSFGIGAAAPLVCALEEMEELPHGGGRGISSSWKSPSLPLLLHPGPSFFIMEYPELEGTRRAHPIQLLMSNSPHL